LSALWHDPFGNDADGRDARMNVALHHSDDLKTLGVLYRRERNGKQRDRYRAVLLGLKGMTEPEIRQRVDRSRTFVQTWVYAYRDHGIAGIAVKKQTGQPTKLPRDQEPAFLDMLAQSDRPLRGRDMVAILQASFGVTYTIQGAYDLLHRLEYVPLKPRPVNPKKDADAEQQWRKRAPFLSGASVVPTARNKSKSGSRTKRGSARKDA
jgi:transposase